MVSGRESIGEAHLLKEKEKEQIKVTDKRIFTPEGDLKEEFRSEIRPAEHPLASPSPKQPAAEPQKDSPSSKNSPSASRQKPAERTSPTGSKRTLADKAANPNTPFSNFIEPLIAQAYVSLGMLASPYQATPAKVDPTAARQMIEILTLLAEKTAGNLTPEEQDFLETHLGELKLAFVQRTKRI